MYHFRHPSHTGGVPSCLPTRHSPTRRAERHGGRGQGRPWAGRALSVRRYRQGVYRLGRGGCEAKRLRWLHRQASPRTGGSASAPPPVERRIHTSPPIHTASRSGAR
eukprot:scaffold26909_cov100-Isochrysis_galbana.AAC.1